MLEVSTVLVLLCLVTFLAFLTRTWSIPYPTIMVLVGAAIAFVPGLPHVQLTPEIVFLVFLPPLLYAAAWQTPIHDFRQNLRPIGLLAVGLVLVTTLVVGVVAHALFPGLPWAAAFALGAIVSPPDAIAATAITQRLRVPRRISVILEGESLLNDAAGLVTYRVALAVAAVLNPNKNWTLAWRCLPVPTSIWMRKRFAALTKMSLNTCDPTFAAMPIAG